MSAQVTGTKKQRAYCLGACQGAESAAGTKTVGVSALVLCVCAHCSGAGQIQAVHASECGMRKHMNTYPPAWRGHMACCLG
jgi:hypothetical protein